jgi:hypothetical protein
MNSIIVEILGMIQDLTCMIASSNPFQMEELKAIYERAGELIRQGIPEK